ncbi:MAG: DUF4344 domain-containing metallopeptidase [Rhizonema sp. NSF051]|nr:DUF4344 domain-containing metallopeptidase [Rhizonema sp. NSF051]
MHTIRADSNLVFFKFYRFLLFEVPLVELLSGCRKNDISLVPTAKNDSREQIEQVPHLHNQISKSTLLYDNKRLLKLKGEQKVLYDTFKKSALQIKTYEKPRFWKKTLGFIAQKFCRRQYISIITPECSCGDTFFQCAKTWSVVFDDKSEDIFYNLYKKQRLILEQQVIFSAFPTTAFVSGSEAEQVVIHQLIRPITGREEDVVNQFSTLLLASNTANVNESERFSKTEIQVSLDQERTQNSVFRTQELIRTKVSRIQLGLFTRECRVKWVRNTKSKIRYSSISSWFESSSNFILRSGFYVLLQHSRLEKMFAFRYAVSS